MMDPKLKKHLDQITESEAQEIIDNNHEIKEWVESQKNGDNPGTTTKPSTGSKDSLGKKTSD